jgi:hypothetical protein
MDWIESLLSSSYFRPCEHHAGGVTNIFHLDSGCALCPACSAKQPAGSLLQARRARRRAQIAVTHGLRARIAPPARRAARAGRANNLPDRPALRRARGPARARVPRARARRAGEALGLTHARRLGVGAADSAQLVP